MIASYILLALTLVLIVINRFVKRYNFIIMIVFSLTYLASLSLFMYFRQDIWVFVVASVVDLLLFLILNKGVKQ